MHPTMVLIHIQALNVSIKLQIEPSQFPPLDVRKKSPHGLKNCFAYNVAPLQPRMQLHKNPDKKKFITPLRTSKYQTLPRADFQQVHL